MNDADLTERIAHGDSRAFDLLFTTHQEAVFRFAYRLSGGDRALAEDATQDTFIRFWRARETYRSGSATLRTYLFTITRRLVSDAQQRHGYNAVGLTEPAQTADSPERLVLSRERMQALTGAILTLNPLLRAVVIRREIEGESYEKIATELNCPVGTVKSRLASARLKLRTALHHYETDTDLPAVHVRHERHFTENIMPKSEPTVNTDLAAELAALRRDVEALKAAQTGTPNTDNGKTPIDRFMDEQMDLLKSDATKNGSPVGIAAGFVVFQNTTTGNGGIGGNVSIWRRGSASEVPDENTLEKRRTRLTALLASPLPLRVLRILTLQRFADQPMQQTVEELSAALNEETETIAEALKPLVDDETLRLVRSGGKTVYEWNGYGLEMVLLLMRD